jgi:hypothetical protein
VTAAVALHPSAEIDIETPHERAHRRVEELRRAASGVLEVLAHIYLDEDWKHLSDHDGQPFTGFTSFVQHALGGSASNARRYRQGVETLIVPLHEITADGTRIPVTPNDIVRLGRGGAEAVLEAAPTALAGITDTTAQTAALRDLLDTVIAEHQALGHERTLPEIPATVPPPALTAGTAGHDPWGSDPDTSAEHTEDTSDGLDDADYTTLRTTLAAVLELDPVSAAGEINAAHSSRLAGDCLAGAQRLARIAQLLKALR